MLTFLEFYHTLLQFVNFKLYHSLAVHYPPLLDSKLEEAAAGLTAIMQDLAQHHAPQVQPAEPNSAQPSAATATAAANQQSQAGAATAGAEQLAVRGVDDGASGSEPDQDAGEIDSGDEGAESASDADEADAPAGESTLSPAGTKASSAVFHNPGNRNDTGLVGGLLNQASHFFLDFCQLL